MYYIRISWGNVAKSTSIGLKTYAQSTTQSSSPYRCHSGPDPESVGKDRERLRTYLLQKVFYCVKASYLLHVF